MREGNDDSRSKLSAWIPKQVHKKAKILATARDIDLQDLVTMALQHYLTDSELDGTAGASTALSKLDLDANRENGNG